MWELYKQVNKWPIASLKKFPARKQKL
jgi:hypothetical protein